MQDEHFACFTIDHINIRGWKSHRAELEGHMRLHGEPHVVAINETHLDKTVAEPELSGFSRVLRLDRRDGRSTGGIMACVRKAVSQRVTLLQHSADTDHERSWLLIHSDIGLILLCVWYRPPARGEIGSIRGFADEWLSLSRSCIGTIMVGDINVHHAHWLRHSSGVTVEGSALYRFCCDNGFRQLV